VLPANSTHTCEKQQWIHSANADGITTVYASSNLAPRKRNISSTLVAGVLKKRIADSRVTALLLSPPNHPSLRMQMELHNLGSRGRGFESHRFQSGCLWQPKRGTVAQPGKARNVSSIFVAALGVFHHIISFYSTKPDNEF